MMMVVVVMMVVMMMVVVVMMAVMMRAVGEVQGKGIWYLGKWLMVLSLLIFFDLYRKQEEGIWISVGIYHLVDVLKARYWA
jgi:hypothetical protein